MLIPKNRIPRKTSFRLTIRNDRGFTLIEVLISITLIGVIMVIIFGGLRIGIRAWESGEKNIEASQHQQIVLDLMRRQLASMRARAFETPDEREIFFSGKPASMAFISGYSLVPGHPYGDVYVRYWVESEGDQYVLKIYENNTLFEGFASSSGRNPGESNTYELTDVQNLGFSYLVEEESESYWTDNWQPDEPKIPLAIRCVFQKNTGMPPVEIFVATHESPAD
ncbi:MAG: prepilin-type N-terminal cleavage/methylation domain-containing protein [Desulfobacterales bacterium]|nr:prepilin-type N-terminal cleavage/methylation domain-containing protein [Desulfobacterales bacterium]